MPVKAKIATNVATKERVVNESRRQRQNVFPMSQNVLSDVLRILYDLESVKAILILVRSR